MSLNTVAPSPYLTQQKQPFSTGINLNCSKSIPRSIKTPRKRMIGLDLVRHRPPACTFVSMGSTSLRCPVPVRLPASPPPPLPPPLPAQWCQTAFQSGGLPDCLARSHRTIDDLPRKFRATVTGSTKLSSMPLRSTIEVDCLDLRWTGSTRCDRNSLKR